MAQHNATFCTCAILRRALIPSLKPVLPPSSRLVALLNRGMLRAPWQQAV